MTITVSSSSINVLNQPLGDEYRSGRRNVINNGDFRLNQRASSAYTTSYSMNLDRWYHAYTAGTVSVSQQTTSMFPGYFYRAMVTVASSLTTSTFFWIAAQQLEGNDVERLNLGSYFAGLHNITVSFWARCSIAGQYSVMIGVRNSSNTWYYTYKTFAINIPNKWEYKTLTFPVNSDISLGNCPTPTIDNNFSFGIWFVGGVGSTYQSTTQGYFQTPVYAGNAANVNLLANYLSTFDLARVQVEAGTVATPFQFVSIAEETKRCMRYYQKSYSYGTAIPTSTFDGAYGYTWTQQRPNYYGSFAFWYTIPFQTRMRATPNVYYYASHNSASGKFSVDQGSYVNKNASSNSISDSSTQVYCSEYPATDGYTGYVEQYYGGYVHYTANSDAGTG